MELSWFFAVVIQNDEGKSTWLLPLRVECPPLASLCSRDNDLIGVMLKYVEKLRSHRCGYMEKKEKCQGMLRR